ncbi:MAG: hypothetical protein ABSE82_08570 [Nitrososphaerales archaeon]|jgi:hypothetical protein
MLGLDPRVSSPQFIADYLVTHLKPDIKHFTEKIGNVHFRTRMMELFPEDKLVPDLFSFTRNAQLKVVNSITAPLPSWFNKEEYLSNLERKVRAYLQDNTDLSDAVKQVHDQEFITNPESAKIFRDAIIILGHRMRQWYKSYETYSAKLLLLSDIPVDYFLLSKDAELAQIASFDIYGNKIRDLDARLGFDRPEKFVYDARIFSSKLSPLVGRGRVLSDSLARLNLYLDLCNSTSLNEMFRLTPYRRDNVDSTIYDNYLQELEMSLTGLNDELLSRQDFTDYELTLSESTRQLRKDLSNVVLA